MVRGGSTNVDTNSDICFNYNWFKTITNLNPNLYMVVAVSTTPPYIVDINIYKIYIARRGNAADLA